MAQMKQQARRGAVDPLQVIQDQEQWTILGQGMQHVAHLLEEVTLIQVIGRIRTALDPFPQPRQPGISATSDRGPGQQRLAGHEGRNHVGAMGKQRLNGVGQGLPQPPGLLREWAAVAWDSRRKS